MADLEKPSRPWTVLAILAGAALLWLPGLGRGLWLDETGTFWVVSGGLEDTVDRSLTYQGQSPFYFVIAWVARIVGQGNEIVLRLPSVMFMAVAAFLMYRLVAALTNRTGALLAAAVFVTSWKIVMEANDARPYALGIVMVVGAMFGLVRWFQTAQRRFAALYVVCAALTVYAHYLLGVMFIVHIIHAVEARRAATRVTLLQVVIAAAAVGVLLLPLVPQFLAVLAKRGTYSWTGTPGLKALAMALVPPVTLAGLLVGLVAARVIAGARIERQRRAPWFAFAWLLVPVLVMFCISRFTATKIFAPMYVIAAEPGVAVLAGWYLRGLRPAHGAPIVVLGLVAVSFVALRFRPFPREDWREAIAEINRLDPGGSAGVMCACGFVEASQLDWLRDPERVKFLNAPLATYPPHGEILRLPDEVPELRDYAAEKLIAFSPRHERLIFIGRGDSAVVWGPWLKSRLEPEQFQMRPMGKHDGVSLLLFERPVPVGQPRSP